MKRSLLKIVTFALIPTLSLATVLCCNLSFIKTAQASTPAMPACHAHKAKASVPVKGNCECCKTKQLQADLPTKMSFDPVQVIIGQMSLLGSFQKSLFFKDEFNLAYLNGPPGPIAQTPLHISFHNFRI